MSALNTLLRPSSLSPIPQVAVIPDASHFVLFSEQEKVIPVIKHFLEGPAERPPFATPGTGFSPR